MIRPRSASWGIYLTIIVVLPILVVFGLPKLNISAQTDSFPPPVYLPLTLRTSPLPPPIFGTEYSTSSIGSLIDLMVDSGVYWVRINAFNWAGIQPTEQNPPVYNWNAVDEQSLVDAENRGLQVIATIRFAPSWAQKEPPYYCSSIKQDKFDEFAQFVKELVLRYSQPPYNIKYWELGNEPDVDPELIPPNSVYGCWGDDQDDYYGGGYYAEMLKVIYPVIKAADPSAQVLIGGLLLNCDPTNPPPGNSCKPAKFFEGILRNGGGNYFDIVNFHGYVPYSTKSSGGPLYNDENTPGWKAREGMVLGKINFLREVMATYGLNKPIMDTEGALLCPEYLNPGCNPPTDAFYQAQADYLVWLFVRNWAEGLKGTVWYSFNGPGWRYCGLLDEHLNPRPAYHSLDFLSQELTGTRYTARLTQYSSLRGYEFNNNQKKIWVLWSPDGESHSISVPSDFQRVFDKYGNDITPPDGELEVNSPIYVEFNH